MWILYNRDPEVLGEQLSESLVWGHTAHPGVAITALLSARKISPEMTPHASQRYEDEEFMWRKDNICKSNAKYYPHTNTACDQKSARTRSCHEKTWKPLRMLSPTTRRNRGYGMSGYLTLLLLNSVACEYHKAILLNVSTFCFTCKIIHHQFFGVL